MAEKLTDSHIKSKMRDAAEAKKRLSIPGGELGLWLRITPAGTTTWVAMITDPSGKLKQITLGEYPGLGIAAARTEARITREQVRLGATPTADRKQEREIGKAERAGIDTLDDLLTTYGKRPKKPKLYNRDVKTVQRVFADHLATHLSKLDRFALQRSISQYPSDSTAALAGRTVRPVLKWAADQGYCTEEVTRFKVPTITSRTRRLLPDELQRLIAAWAASKSVYAKAQHLILLTGCRNQEIGAMKWAEIDNGVFRTTRVKGTKDVVGDARELKIKLPTQAVALLATLPKKNAYVFGGALKNWHRIKADFQTASGTEGWHQHDLRRTTATAFGKLGYGPHLTEALLNHVELHSKLASVYNTARYYTEVSEALQIWADALDTVVAGDQTMIEKLR
jgi:integrase